MKQVTKTQLEDIVEYISDNIGGYIYNSAAQNIAPMEATTTTSREYKVGEQFYYDKILYAATAPIANGGTIVTSGANKNCEPSPTLTEQLADLGTSAYKNSTSVVTQSTDLVESGAVFDVVGWGNKNELDCRLETLKALNTYGTWSNNVFTRNGISYTVNSDLTITINGTCSSSNSLMYLTPNADLGFIGKHYGTEAFSNDDYGAYITSSVPTISVPSEGVVIPSEVGNTYRLGIRVFHDKTVNNVVFKPMVCDNNLSDKTYEPYHASVADSLEEKADNSVIAPVENGSTASQAYAVGSHAIRNGAFITWKNAKAQGETIADSDYDSGNVADEMSPEKKNITTSNANITIVSQNCYKYGKVVNFVANFTASAEIPASTAILVLPYTPYMALLFELYDSTVYTPVNYTVGTRSDNGTLNTRQILPAGSYRISGCLICQ